MSKQLDGLEHFREMAKRAGTLHRTLADSIGNPDRVYCRKCGRSEPVDAATCLRHGWPKCCAATMTIDKPGKP